MNYLMEVNRFYGWITTHPLSAQAQALWNLLMSIDNRAGWPEDFTVPTSTLAAALDISRTQLSRCRRELIDNRRICHFQRKGGQAPIYRLLTFENESSMKADPATKLPQPGSSGGKGGHLRRVK